jgi:iron complex transport system ATP-binding protein
MKTAFFLFRGSCIIGSKNALKAGKNMTLLLGMQSVSYFRNGKPILQDIDWQVEKGSHWVILGRNGSGKTTLLQLINGYIWPSTGSMELFGKRFGTFDIREMRRKVGWVSQAILSMIHTQDETWKVVVTGKYGALTMYEETPEADRQMALALLEKQGTIHLADKSFQLLSQGEKQKILISRALMANPSLLILDEPCSGLDLKAREELLQSVERLASENKEITIFYVTHHTEEIMPSIQNALLISEGRITAAGDKKQILCPQVLSELFEIPVQIEWDQGRPWTRMTAPLMQKG